jgi:hypothetical protein
MKNKQKEWHHATKHLKKQVPDPEQHQSEKSDPDPHQSEKSYSDLQQSWIRTNVVRIRNTVKNTDW